jgi:hypothetical protein
VSYQRRRRQRFAWSCRPAIGAGVIACADIATDQAKPATAINLIVILRLS